MKTIISSTLLLCTALATRKVNNALVPEPGSLSTTLSVPSLNNILGLGIPLAINQVLNNHTFDLDYTSKGLWGLYYIHIDSITTNSVDVGERKLDFVGDSNTLELSIKGINLDATMIGKATAAKLIPASIDAFTIKNLTLNLKLNTTSSDQVIYKLGGSSYFHIDDFTITMGQWVWQKLVDVNHGLLLSILNTGIEKILPAYIEGRVGAFNRRVSRNDNFIWKLLNGRVPLNVTATKYPEFRHSDQMIEVHLDGRVTDKANPSFSVAPNSIWQPRENTKQLEQFFIHQSTVNSLFFDLSDSLMPLSLNSPSLSAQLLQLFPELRLHYGVDVNLELGVTLAENQTD